MYCLRYLFRYSGSIERFSTYFRQLSDEKSKFIKDLNYENRLLYGKLLETRKQRKKSIAIMKGFLKKPEEDILESHLQDKINSKSGTVRKKISKKSVADVYNNDMEESIIGEHLNKKSTKKVKSNKEGTALLNEETIISGNASFTSPDQSTSSGTGVVISENNYPLENPLKPVNKQFSPKSVISYGFNDPVVKQYAHLPSVSKIIEETMSENNRLILSKWKQRMIKNLGEDGFNKYSEDIKCQGQEFHEAVRRRVLGEKNAAEGEGVIGRALQSLSWVLKQVSRPMAVESILAHPQLGYKGIPDCVARFRDTPVVIDWKLSEKPKRDIKDTFEAPVQVTAYIGALNHDRNYKWAVNHGLVVVAYHSGEPCDVFLLSPKYCQVYWRHWLVRFDKFKARTHLHLDHNIDEKLLK